MSITKKIQRCVGLGTLFLLMSPAFATSVPSAAAVCTSCHLTTGMGSPNTKPNPAPMIAGQDPEYLTNQINHFLSGKRSDPLMTAMAVMVSDPQKKAEAVNYFASLSTPDIKNLEQRGDHVIIYDPARKLVYQGDWKRNIPACSTCHGASGIGVEAFPRLANQHPNYIEMQLTAWKNNTRSGDLNDVMGSIARQLTNTEISQLALYFANVK
ncbi:diheme-containing protein c4 [Psychromonas ingrahamii 37]|uniref:Diheme-containing protein c4 n=1 Tax=Psychromonas ingrahamii (strain DSM 17664 / CCUG 51855 / 37) TaxID=357804 RepID=A1SUH1_PSYIN|nr:c-type cytochrome [Psychromonas ingrahamii]ABM03136.1 diheme-containing protein c4 [Psychromonas ingrahamii 37]